MPRFRTKKGISTQRGPATLRPARNRRSARMAAIEKGAILSIYRRLYRALGPQGWWPARTATEVVIGAILTQNTAWKNVERAMKRLRAAGAVTWRGLRGLDDRQLEDLLRPAGTYRVKARRLRAFVDALWRDHGGSLRQMLAGDLDAARQRLLSIPGVGPETADAILLYAGNRPSFVVDAYTKRILRRHFLVDSRADHEEVRHLFQSSLPEDAALFNEYHALLVELGKRHCRVRASCQECPLKRMPHDATL